MQPLVYTCLSDGLGNQLFQYAIGRALADRIGAELRLDCSCFSGNSSRPFELDAYSIVAERSWDIQKVPTRWFRLPGRIGKPFTAAVHNGVPRRATIHGHSYKVFDEKRIYRFDPSFSTLNGSVYLTGWWQSPRYFESSSESIRRELRLKAPLGRLSRDWLGQIQSVAAVAIHVRRGDYLLSPDRSTCSPAYYDAGMDLVRSRVSEARFFVFSDDPQWCRQHFSRRDTVIIDANGPEGAVADLALMAACRHHVIANSSFSWWGAWLCDAADQIVVAPENWVVGIPTTDDLVARRWQRFYRL